MALACCKWRAARVVYHVPASYVVLVGVIWCKSANLVKGSVFIHAYTAKIHYMNMMLQNAFLNERHDAPPLHDNVQ